MKFQLIEKIAELKGELASLTTGFETELKNLQRVNSIRTQIAFYKHELEKCEAGEILKNAVPSLGEKIEQFRLECGWSIEDLEKHSGLDKRQIYRHIKGKIAPRPNTLKIYADTFSKALNRQIQVKDLLT